MTGKRVGEEPGTRYGNRVVTGKGVEYIVSGGAKQLALWVRCDCGYVSLVLKSALRAGKSQKCSPCHGKVLYERHNTTRQALS